MPAITSIASPDHAPKGPAPASRELGWPWCRAYLAPMVGSPRMALENLGQRCEGNLTTA